MNAPQPHNLASQRFNSEQMEFTWLFNRTDKIKDQFILQIQRNPVIYIEAGTIDDSGLYVDGHVEYKFGYGHLRPDAFLTSELNWPDQKFPEVYKNFTNGQDLIPLVEEVINYLHS